MSHHAPVQLMVEEAVPGAYTWTLRETDDQGKAQRVLRRSEDSFDSYELALASGSRALTVQMHQAAQAH